MKKEEVRKIKIQECVSKGLDHCTSMKDFENYVHEILPFLHEYGNDLLEEFYKYEDVFYNKLKKYNYVVNPENVHVSLFVPCMYLKSLQTNYVKTVKHQFNIFYRVNEYDVGKHIVSNEYMVKEYVKVLRENGFDLSNVKGIYPKFMYVPCFIASLYIKGNGINTLSSGENYFKRMSKSEQKYLYLNYFKSKDPASYPQYVVESDIFLEDKFAKAPNFRRLLKEILTTDVYNKDHEKQLLDILKLEHASLDSWFDEFYDNGKNAFINRMKFGAKVLLTLYIKKIAHSMGIEKCKVNMFDYNPDYSGVASKKDASVGVNLNKVLFNGQNLLNVIYHELTHLKQYQNIANMAYDKDADIDIYCKDEIIQRVFGREYYTMNYLRIASEVNAVYNAQILCEEYRNDKEELYSHYKKIGEKEINENFELISNQELDIEHMNKRYIKLEVNGKKQRVSKDLNELFLIALNQLDTSLLTKEKELLNSICKEYPIIKYDYKFEHPIVRKSALELVDDLVNASEEEKGIYKYLLLQRLKRDKNTKLDVKETCEKLRKMQEESNDIEFKHMIGKILAKDTRIRVEKVKKNG